MKQRFPTSKENALRARAIKKCEPVALMHEHPDRVPVKVYPTGPYRRKPRGNGRWGDTFSGKQS
jgi:hypothetical protein